jgi:hypothetical protein
MKKLNRLLIIKLLKIVHNNFLCRELSGTRINQDEKDTYFTVKKLVLKNDKDNEFFYKG